MCGSVYAPLVFVVFVAIAIHHLHSGLTISMTLPHAGSSYTLCFCVFSVLYTKMHSRVHNLVIHSAM